MQCYKCKNVLQEAKDIDNDVNAFYVNIPTIKCYQCKMVMNEEFHHNNLNYEKEAFDEIYGSYGTRLCGCLNKVPMDFNPSVLVARYSSKRVEFKVSACQICRGLITVRLSNDNFFRNPQE